MFLHPWAIVLGVLAAGLPVLIHWLTRPRPVRFPLSTLRFVREAVLQRRAKHRLRDFIVLALRTLAVLLLAAAVARPLIGQKESVVTNEGTEAVRIVILDVSQSMAAETRGIRAFERARALASSRLEYRAGLKVNLILAAARPSPVFQSPSRNFAALSDELTQAAPRPERLNVQPALNLAAEMLAQAGQRDGIRRELIVVSDFQRSNWASADFSTFPSDTVIQLESVAPEETPPNLAVLSVSSQGRCEIGREIQLEVVVGNYSPTPRQVRVEVAVGDTVYPFEGHCAANSKTTLSREILPTRVGWQIGTARLLGVEDALPDDNTRACVLEVRPPPVYALITRQSENQRPSSSYYLQRGLVPIGPGQGNTETRIVRIDPSELDLETLGPAELIVLDHPGKLSAEAINQLASLLRRGRGVLYVAAEPIDATNLKRLTKAVGTGLEMPVEFAPAPVGQSRRNLFLAEYQRDQPPFQIFGDSVTPLPGEFSASANGQHDQSGSEARTLSIVSQSFGKFAGGLTSRRLEGALSDDILATFNDRSAFLVSTSTDSGTLVVLNADLGASNLPASPLFVPLLGELVQRCLLRRGRNASAAACGEPLAVYLPADVQGIEGLELAGPDSGSKVADELKQESVGVLWHTEAAGPPGVYRVKRGDKTVFAAATAIPDDECDLRVLPASVFKDRLAGGRDVRFRSAVNSTGNSKDVIWTWLALACMTCLLGEVLALKVFRM